MPSAFFLACLLMALIGIGIALFGGRMLIADQRLEARLARLAPTRQAKPALRLPTIRGAWGQRPTGGKGRASAVLWCREASGLRGDLAAEGITLRLIADGGEEGFRLGILTGRL